MDEDAVGYLIYARATIWKRSETLPDGSPPMLYCGFFRAETKHFNKEEMWERQVAWRKDVLIIPVYTTEKLPCI